VEQQLAAGLTERQIAEFVDDDEIVAQQLPDRRPLHGLDETETSITGKLARGTFAASFLLACLSALEIEGVMLEDL
jgi:hypothetical protein